MSFLGAVLFAVFSYAGPSVSTWAGNSCAIESNQLWCWGSNQSGQKGNGTTGFVNMVSPTLMPTGGTPTSVDVYNNGICASVSGVGVKCWGANSFGIVGTAANPATVPTLIAGTSLATHVAAGTSHACARLSDGSVRCWGYNANGQLGDGTKVNRTAVVAPPVFGTVQVSAGQSTSCARSNLGGLSCWGAVNGAVAGDAVAPMGVPGLINGVTDVAVGHTHACAVQSGALKCWGSNSLGQLGIAPPVTSSTTPLALPAPMNANVVDVECGHNITCAIKSDGSSYCWGSNTVNGYFGINSTSPLATHVPQQLNGIGASGAQEMAIGNLGGCQLNAGTWYCWGSDQTDRIGDPGASHPELAPYPLAL